MEGDSRRRATSPPASSRASLGSGEKVPEARSAASREPNLAVESNQKDALWGARVSTRLVAGKLASPVPQGNFTPTFTLTGSYLGPTGQIVRDRMECGM